MSAEYGVVGANGKFDSFEALQEFVDLDGHCEFLGAVINENNWQKTNIASRFEQLEDQKNDQRLMLGIIGEFSSGKTTLVNALRSPGNVGPTSNDVCCNLYLLEFNDNGGGAVQGSIHPRPMGTHFHSTACAPPSTSSVD